VKNRFHKHIAKRFMDRHPSDAQDSPDAEQKQSSEPPIMGIVEVSPPLTKPGLSAYLESVLN
jgi:hypothetical protein